MVIQFKNRKKELKNLNEILTSDRFEFVVIYGRRRIGKTSLVLEATKKMKRLYFLATEENNLNRFYNTCAQHFPEVQSLKKDYEVLFNFLKDKVEVIIIDEFQNMIKEDKSIVSLFQVIVDEILVKSKVKLFLLGSSISMISSRVLSYKSPLYGRRTASLKVKKIPFQHIKHFFSHSSFEELLHIYGFADGIPYYLVKVRTPFWRWLSDEIKNEFSFLRDEIDFLMRYEFEDVGTYKLILQAIAFGNTKINEIKNFLQIKRTDISPYLRNLIETEFVERRVPVTENEKSRKGRYYLKDNFLRFWFKFIYPNLSLIEEGTFDVREIKREYNEYLGHVFEDVCRELLKNMNIFRYDKLGNWWYKDKEIDIVALNRRNKEILFGEVKWKTRVNAKKIVENLNEKINYVKWYNEKRKEIFVVFAKSFSKKINDFDGKKVYCFDLDDLEKVVRHAT